MIPCEAAEEMGSLERGDSDIHPGRFQHLARGREGTVSWRQPGEQREHKASRPGRGEDWHDRQGTCGVCPPGPAFGGSRVVCAPLTLCPDFPVLPLPWEIWPETKT